MIATTQSATASPGSITEPAAPPPAATPMGPAYAASLGAAFGLLTGVGEVALVAVKKFYLHTYLHRDHQSVWMAPVAYVLGFAIFGAGLGWAARLAPRRVTRRVVTATFAFLGAWTLLLLSGSIGPVARVILAAGLARVAAAWLTARPHRLTALIAHTFAWTAALRRTARSEPRPPAEATPSRRDLLVSTGATAAALAAGTRLWEFRLHTPGRLGSAPTAVPNVLLLVLDTVRAESTSLYGGLRPTTPNLEQLAGTGVCFERALATASWTLPSHASMFTGRLPHELSCDFWVPLDGRYPTLAEVLGGHGFDTAGFAANVYYCTKESGLARGFRHYEDFSVSLGQFGLNSSLGNWARVNLKDWVDLKQLLVRKGADRVNADFLDWVSHRPTGRPYFAFLNYMDAHMPYYPSTEFAARFCPRRQLPGVREGATVGPDDLVAMHETYLGAVAGLDDRVGALIETLDRRGLLENTLLVVVGDHGEQFGEHGLIDHCSSMYMQVLHVPLIVRLPGGAHAGTRVAAPVSLRDLPATIVDVLGLAGGHPFPGQSLRPVWAGDRPRPAVAGVLSTAKSCMGYSTTGELVKTWGVQSLVVGGLHYLRTGSKREELYDIVADAREECDLATTDRGRLALPALRQQLITLVESSRSSG